jgi:uncharacterized protein
VKMNVSCLLNRTKSKLDLDFEEDLESFEFLEDNIRFKKPIKFKGSLYSDEEFIVLTGKLEVIILASCARCLEEVEDNMIIEIEDKFTDNSNLDSEEDFDFIEDNQIDLENVFKVHIIEQLPIRYICSPNCLGLCSHCGKNLNKGLCGCKEDDIDPRLEKLKHLNIGRCE